MNTQITLKNIHTGDTITGILIFSETRPSARGALYTQWRVALSSTHTVNVSNFQGWCEVPA